MTYIDEIAHPLDIRGIDTDPALVDLQPYKDDVHDDRLQREKKQAERRKEHLRAKCEGQGEIKTIVPRMKA